MSTEALLGCKTENSGEVVMEINIDNEEDKQSLQMEEASMEFNE